MKSSILAAVAAAALISAGTASAAETRSASAMPTASVAKIGNLGAVSTSRGSSRTSEESKLDGGLGALPLIFLVGGLGLSIYLITKSKG